MNKKEFLQRTLSTSIQTSHLRLSNSQTAFRAIYTVPDDLIESFATILLLLDNIIKSGQLCEENEYLLIYNFQILLDGDVFFSIDTVIKPLNEIRNIHDTRGKPLQLAVNRETGEVVNNEWVMNYLSKNDDLWENVDSEDLENAKCYGNYKHSLKENSPDNSSDITDESNKIRRYTF